MIGDVKHKIVAIARWMGTRVFFVYVVIFVALGTVVDLSLIWSNARIRSLNRLMPAMEGLADVVAGRRNLSPEEWDEYIGYYKRLLRLSRNDPGGNFFFATVCGMSGREEEGFEYLRYAVENIKGLFFVDYNFAVALYNRGNYGSAIEWFQQAVDDPPDRMLHYMRDAKMYLQVIFPILNSGFHVEGSLVKRYQEAHLMIAKSWFLMGKYDEAISVVHYCLDKGWGGNTDFFHIAALSLEKLGRDHEAVIVFTKLVEADPYNLTVWDELLSALDRLGLKEKRAEMARARKKFEELGAKREELFKKAEYHLL
ncbi:MAG TPA: tetratricopeptide repeat protein [Candidatus Bathyarchaeia archaeon]|nr:tetratricopeptide repeat protein [Candidatus Bathyarchaeia archaeon]